jgi:hypothetical protein
MFWAMMFLCGTFNWSMPAVYKYHQTLLQPQSCQIRQELNLWIESPLLLIWQQPNLHINPSHSHPHFSKVSPPILFHLHNRFCSFRWAYTRPQQTAFCLTRVVKSGPSFQSVLILPHYMLVGLFLLIIIYFGQMVLAIIASVSYWVVIYVTMLSQCW